MIIIKRPQHLRLCYLNITQLYLSNNTMQFFQYVFSVALLLPLGALGAPQGLGALVSPTHT